MIVRRCADGLAGEYSLLVLRGDSTTLGAEGDCQCADWGLLKKSSWRPARFSKRPVMSPTARFEGQHLNAEGFFNSPTVPWSTKEYS